ncbi:hypothetical protein Dsin_021317 [Dipteronia sinensis]|uniref:MULE transposase domain-containing protein n=1 Tax=Dipteronia sinensis TaxID=43782 RepID=A0AAE0A0F7_9ROSI|nr:hypothetical protein Dsin_021317 [Dipteronia sinensis]
MNGVGRKEHYMFWHVKKFIRTHTCERDVYGGQFRAANANVIGQFYAPKLSSGDNICPKDIMRDMREKHGVELLYTKVWMSMQHARSTVYGKADESYQFLPGYFHILAEANPSTVIAIEMDEHNRFLYAFLSFRQSLQGFHSVIRPHVAIDATYLKSDYEGVMFVATCKDDTDMVYPLAFGFGDGETDEAWTWFLLHICEEIGTHEHLVLYLIVIIAL